MLNQVRIQNYKCLRDVTVDLADFTVLIGPNDSGKTSFLEALRDLGRLAREPHQVFAEPRSVKNLLWQKDFERDLIWDAAGVAGEPPFTFSPRTGVAHRRLSHGGLAQPVHSRRSVTIGIYPSIRNPTGFARQGTV